MQVNGILHLPEFLCPDITDMAEDVQPVWHLWETIYKIIKQS